MPPALLVLCVAAVLALAACRSGGPRASGILGDRSVFKKRDADTLVHRVASNDDFKKYQRVLLEPVLIYLDPGSQWSDVSPSGQRRFKKLLHDALTRELSASFQVIFDPGARSEDVLIVRAAITDVTTPEDGGKGSDIASSTVEIELLDGITRARLAAVIARSHVRFSREDADHEAEAREVVDGWARGLREWLDEVARDAS